jgi:hypothetical protein
MADKVAQKTILFKFNAEAGAAAKEVDKLKRTLREAKFAQQEAKFAGDEHKLSLLKQQRALVEAQEAQKSATRSAKVYSQEIEKATTASGRFQKGLRKAFEGAADLRAGLGMVAGAIKATVGTLDKFLDKGAKYNNLLNANTISVHKAEQSTKGLLSKMDLLEAANKSVAFGLGLNNEQFAKLAKGAAIAAQKIGGDVTKSMNDLVLGIGRQSRLILDNLGLIVSTEEANKDYAKQLGKTVASLTDAEKKTAFMNATLKELNRFTKDGEVVAENMGGAWQQAKIQLENAFNEIGKSIAASKKFGIYMGEVAEQVKFLGRSLGLLKSRIDEVTEGFDMGALAMGHWAVKAKVAFDQTKAARDLLAKIEGDVPERILELRRKREEALKKGRKSKKGKGSEFQAETLEQENKREALAVEQQFSRLARKEARADLRYKMQLARREKRLLKQKGKLYDKYAKGVIKSQESIQQSLYESHQQALHQREQMALAIMTETAALMANAQSAGEFFGGMAQMAIKAVQQIAFVEAAKNIALALSAQGVTWGIPNPSSVNHWAAAAAWFAIGAGAGVANAAIGGAMSGGGGGGGGGGGVSSGPSQSVSTRTSQSHGRSSSDDRSNEPTHVTNIYLRGRTGLVTRRDLKNFSRKLSEGRL